MKIEMIKTTPRRGGEVVVGNVYANVHGKDVFKIALAVIERDKWDKPWKNVVLLRVGVTGNIIGCGMEPFEYMSEHQDHVGVVKELPTLKVEWLADS